MIFDTDQITASLPWFDHTAIRLLINLVFINPEVYQKCMLLRNKTYILKAYLKRNSGGNKKS